MEKQNLKFKKKKSEETKRKKILKPVERRNNVPEEWNVLVFCRRNVVESAHSIYLCGKF